MATEAEDAPTLVPGMEIELAYDDTNIFARILRGEIPSHKVFEDELTLAFMDVSPISKGHTLVVPKAKARNVIG